MAKNVQVISKQMKSIKLTDGSNITLAPTAGYLFGELDKPSKLYLALSDGERECGVFLNENEIKTLLNLIWDMPK